MCDNQIIFFFSDFQNMMLIVSYWFSLYAFSDYLSLTFIPSFHLNKVKLSTGQRCKFKLTV